MSRFNYQYGFSLVVFVLLYTLVECQCLSKNASIDYNDPLCVSADSSIIDLSVYYINGKFIIKDTIDLNRKTLYLPPNVELVLKKGFLKMVVSLVTIPA